MARKATHGYYSRIAVVFDLDDTLAPDTYASVVASCGLDPEQFDRERVAPLKKDGWDEVLAKFSCLVEEAARRDGGITRDHLAKVGRDVELFPGVTEMFGRLKQAARETDGDNEVEFYLLSAGLYDVACALPIAGHFEKIWGCKFAFDDRGLVRFIKQIVTHPEKIRYLRALSRGIEANNPDSQVAELFRPISEEELHIPLDQVIYVGDGASDLPAFSFLDDENGIAIGVFKGGDVRDWRGYQDIHAGVRVQNLAPADFGEGSELMESLLLAVRQICYRIALRKLARGE